VQTGSGAIRRTGYDPASARRATRGGTDVHDQEIRRYAIESSQLSTRLLTPDSLREESGVRTGRDRRLDRSAGGRTAGLEFNPLEMRDRAPAREPRDACFVVARSGDIARGV